MASESEMSVIIVDLRSDTVTKPTESMKKAMYSATVGDDVYCEDPTANILETKVAEILGKEASLFVPSGTMANLIATMVHCNKRGSEMLCGDLSHIYKREGGLSELGGVLVTAIKNLPDGTFDLAELENHVRGSDIHEPVTMMVCIENTHSFCGGKVLPLEWLDQLAAVSKKNGLALHMDGARLFNAAEYLHIQPGTIAQYCDSLSVCFSKSLGAPVGSALVGTRRFIDQARRYRKMLGGGMRQVGVIAAAALVALDESIPSLGVDHRKAQILGEAINSLRLSTFTVDLINLHTNIVHVNINNSKVTSKKVAERLTLTTQAELSEDYTLRHSVAVLCSSKPDSRTVRFVTHHDVDDNNLTLAVKKIQFVLKEIDRNCK